MVIIQICGGRRSLMKLPLTIVGGATFCGLKHYLKVKPPGKTRIAESVSKAFLFVRTRDLAEDHCEFQHVPRFGRSQSVCRSPGYC